MRPKILNILTCAVSLGVMLSAPAESAEQERGIAITDGRDLRELDLRERFPAQRSLSLAVMLGADKSASSSDIFALPAMKLLRATLDREFDNYATRQDAAAHQPFDRGALYAKQTRFILAGVVNRIDRAFKSPATCGEIRLIYRPVTNFRISAANRITASERLPMTLSVVLNARNKEERQIVPCAEIARRWLALEGQRKSGIELPGALMASGGALEFVTPAHIDRIETNIQISRASTNPNDFEARADYLMKIFNFDPATKSFIEAAMENQIDRERLSGDATLAAEFKQWLLTPENFAALDKGIVLIPEKFLANRAIVATPAIASNTQGIFEGTEIVDALAKASAKNIDLQTIKSPAGFERRLNDSTCAGCHQTRSIGGFHFPGTDWSNDARGIVLTPASPHFFGDQPRRRDILTAFRDTKRLDFSRGFSARPQQRRSGELEGTTYLNGWGAHCYTQPADKSFASWTCGDGLVCQMTAQVGENSGALATRSGLCFPKAD